jgi:hypothetical protein
MITTDRLRRMLKPKSSIEVDSMLLAVGELRSHLNRVDPPTGIKEAEFKVFSQWNEDGILAYLTQAAPCPARTFVEIGVQDYSESNTRFLATSGNWSGICIDDGVAHVDFVRRQGLDWRYGVRAVSAFVTTDNINKLIRDGGPTGDIGLLSVDVDGQDYWLWEAVTEISPRIVVVEYNGVLGLEAAVTVPQQDDFSYFEAHPSGIYFGASLPALVALGRQKGYRFVGCESHGANAFFVRDDVAGALPNLTAEQGFVESRFRTSRSDTGVLDFETDRRAKLRRISDLPLMDVTTGATSSVASVYDV